MLSSRNVLLLRRDLRKLEGFDFYIQHKGSHIKIIDSDSPLAVIADARPFKKYIQQSRKNGENFTLLMNKKIRI